MLRTTAALLAALAAALLAGCGGGPAGGAPRATGVPPSRGADPAGGPVVMIIRHGEKPEGGRPGVDAAGREDDSSLTAAGWTRAHALARLFAPGRGESPMGLARPTAIYAAGANDEGEGQRTRETVAPLADVLGVPVDTGFGRGQEKKLARAVEEAGAAVTLISWQHGGIPAIVDAFDHVRPDPPREWPDDRFDLVWVLTRTADGWAFAQVPERILPGDRTDVVEG